MKLRTIEGMSLYIEGMSLYNECVTDGLEYDQRLLAFSIALRCLIAAVIAPVPNQRAAASPR
jgi:hypothetical protein